MVGVILTNRAIHVEPLDPLSPPVLSSKHLKYASDYSHHSTIYDTQVLWKWLPNFTHLVSLWWMQHKFQLKEPCIIIYGTIVATAWLQRVRSATVEHMVILHSYIPLSMTCLCIMYVYTCRDLAEKAGRRRRLVSSQL